MATPAEGSVPAQRRVGIVGLGKMGLLHAAIFNALPGSRVVAVAEPQPFLLEFLLNLQPSIQSFPTLQAMLDRVPLDAVVITTPVSDHVPAGLACVERGVSFFMEKPLAASVGQAEDLRRALAARPVPHMVGFMTRFVDSFRKGKELLEAGCLGNVHRAAGTIYVSQCFSRGQGWRYDRSKSGGGVLLAQGSHLLDLLTWYFGPMARVSAQTASPYSAQVEDIAHLMCGFRSGLQGWVDCSWSAPSRRTVETTIEIWGEAGSLVVTDDTVSLSLDRPFGEWSKGRTLWQPPDLYQGVTVDIGGPQYSREDELFIHALESGARMEPDVDQAFHVQQIVEACYASAADSGAPRGLSA